MVIQAIKLITEICSHLSAAAKTIGNSDYTVVLRGDSTLRGHFPEVSALAVLHSNLTIRFLFLQVVPVTFDVQEADAVVSVIGEVYAWIVCPFFLQGGRYTVADIHYVADSERLLFPCCHLI